MGKGSKAKNFQQQQQQQQCDDIMAIDPDTMPLAHAVQAMDTAAFSVFLQQKVLPKDAEVTDCTIEQSRGEAFTGGRSTPVYYISCQITRKQQHNNAAATVRRRQRNFVVKLISLPGSDDDVWRKRESYAVERRFYESEASDRIRTNASLLPHPKLLYSDRDGSRAWPVQCFLLNDLRTAFPCHPDFLSTSQAKRALQWLATLHATFWGGDGSSGKQRWRRDLWDRGGFWTTAATASSEKADSKMIAAQWVPTMRWLESKQPTYCTTLTKGLGSRLQAAAGPIARFLTAASAPTSSYSTLIHGDYKAANLFFKHDQDDACGGDNGAQSVAALDFQYTGAGVGAEDVAYLLYPDARGHYFDVEDELLETYHEQLVSQLMQTQKGGPSSMPLDIFRQFYELGRVDLTLYWLSRGWVASTVGDARLVSALEATMNRLDGGTALPNQQAYEVALANFVDVSIKK